LLGDWSLDGPKTVVVEQEMPLTPSVGENNRHYKGIIQKLFKESGAQWGATQVATPLLPNAVNGAASLMAVKVGGPMEYPSPNPYQQGTPCDERVYWMSFVGIEGSAFENFGPYANGYQPAPYLDETRTANRGNNPGCSYCHFNTAGTSTVNDIMSFGGFSGIAQATIFDLYHDLRRQCFAGVGGPGCP
jgi:hypothetical protein